MLPNVPIQVSDYLSIFSMQRWGHQHDGTLVSSPVYVHSKLMVVDDRVALVGR